MKNPSREAGECDCYECVEARRQPAGRQGCCERPGTPVDAALQSWQSAFQEAYREVQIEIFKSKIKASMAKSMEKTATLVLEAMMAEIRESARRADFQKELREKFAKLIQTAGE